jgi:hypothetical protein
MTAHDGMTSFRRGQQTKMGTYVTHACSCDLMLTFRANLATEVGFAVQSSYGMLRERNCGVI